MNSEASTGLSYRLLGPAEWEVLRPLWEQLNQLHAALPTPFAAEIAARTFSPRLLAFREKAATGRLRVEIVCPTPGGSPVAYCVTSLSSEGAGEVDSLFVSPEYRRRGVASALLRNAVDWLRDSGAKSQRVVVLQANEEAIAFYRRFGFHSRNLELERI